ncbi:MAG: 1,4-alpha-glucan branching protein domain-containing protein [Anaerolineae bacterium]
MPVYGAFTFVLHTHLPYARLAGRWPHGEEWLHEAAVDTYIPLLKTLYDLKEQGIFFRLTIGITPVLAEQLIDADVLKHLDQYLDEKIAAAQRDVEFFAAGESADPHLHWLAQQYEKHFKNIQSAFHHRFNRDLIGAFRRLQDEGLIEIITCAATHAYLPLLGRDSSINAQLTTAVKSYERLFGRKPTSIWLPECAYRPAYVTEDGRTRPGIETFLRQHGIKLFFSETHTITGGQPVGVAAGEVIGPYGYLKRRYLIPSSPKLLMPEHPATTFQSYYVSDTVAGMGAGEHSGVAVIGRNNQTGMQVWSAEWGYPGDVDYREFHKKAWTSGLQYWRVTGTKLDLAEKDQYHPDWAAYKIDQHAEHFAHMVGDLLRDYYKQTGEYGLIASNYDTELFGHWWYEGVEWLGKVLRHLAANRDIELTTASSYLDNHPPREVLHIPESSWGSNGTHFTWDNHETHWMWQPIHECEVRMENLAARYPGVSDDQRLVLNQAARELLLLQSSDWPFLVTTEQAREYAIQRFSQHLERFNKLADSLDAGKPNRELAESYYELDKLFPDIDYRWFAS